MKSIELINRVKIALSILQGVFVLLAIMLLFSSFYSYSGTFLINKAQEVNIPYKLSYEQVDLLRETGAPLLNSRPFTLKDGKKEFILLEGREETSRYSINNKTLLHPLSWQGLVSMTFSLFYIVLILYGIFLLKKLLTNSMKNTPFLQQNVTIIRTLAYLIFGFVFTGWLYNDVIRPMIKQSIDVSYNWEFSISISTTAFSYLILGFLILILASVFEHGVELKEETALTI